MLIVLFLLTLASLLVVTIRGKSFLKDEVYANELVYHNYQNKKQCVISKNQPIVILFYNTKCRFCRYQLNILESKADSISSFCLYLLTTDSLYFKKEMNQKWQKLSRSSACTFGFIDQSDLLQKFGKIHTPSIVIFSADLQLYGVLRGVQDWRQILRTVNASKYDMKQQRTEATWKN
jgi:hypothetical protein